jgi:hypothetical protein
MLSVIMLNVTTKPFMLIAIKPIMLSVIMLIVTIKLVVLSVIMLSVTMLSVTIKPSCVLNIIVLSFEFYYIVCMDAMHHNAQC